MLTKPLPWFALCVFLEPFLLWKGDTMETGASRPAGSGTNPEGNDVDPGLAQDQDLSEMATNGHDSNQNTQNMHTNLF